MVVNYVHHVALVPHWVGVMLAHCAYFVFHYSGLQFACYVLGLVGHALGLEALWSMLAYAFTHWWLLAPLRYSLAQFLPLLSINALGWFMLTWLGTQAAYRIIEAYRQIDWLDLWLEYKPQIDVFPRPFLLLRQHCSLLRY